MKEAIALDDVSIVNFDWLDQSLLSKTKADESKYLLHPRNATNTATKAGSKRSRAASPDDNSAQSQAKKAKSGPQLSNGKGTNASKTNAVNIPLDDELPNKHMYKVHIDDDDTIYDVTLNQTNSGNNNNKFYRIQLLIDSKNGYWCWTRWGRVGERGQMKMLGDGNFDAAFKEFEKKFKVSFSFSRRSPLTGIRTKMVTNGPIDFQRSSLASTATSSVHTKILATKMMQDHQNWKSVWPPKGKPLTRKMKSQLKANFWNQFKDSCD